MTRKVSDFVPRYNGKVRKFFADLTSTCNICIVAVVLALAGKGLRIVGARLGWATCVSFG